MKKILMALGIIVIAYASAEAQIKCGTNEKKVCKHTSDKSGLACYETKYAQNYKVCKGGTGYYICCGKLDDATGEVADEAIDHPIINDYEAAFPEDNPVTPPAVACGENEKQVCKKGANGNAYCYKTEYAQNYKVCKGNAGYYICCSPKHTANGSYKP